MTSFWLLLFYYNFRNLKKLRKLLLKKKSSFLIPHFLSRRTRSLTFSFSISLSQCRGAGPHHCWQSPLNSRSPSSIALAPCGRSPNPFPQPRRHDRNVHRWVLHESPKGPAKLPVSISLDSTTTVASPSPETAACASSRSRIRLNLSPFVPCPLFLVCFLSIFLLALLATADLDRLSVLPPKFVV